MLIQARPVFFSLKENLKRTKKKIRNFSIVRLVSKISHPRLAAHWLKTKITQKLDIISSISASCVINIVARILCFCKTGILFLGRLVGSRKWAPDWRNCGSCVGLNAENGATLLVGIWWGENKRKLVEWKALVDTAGIKSTDLEDKFLFQSFSASRTA